MLKYRGFTLVELLVSISILAILSSIAMISYSNIQKNVRDAKRKSDIASIQAAMEQYHADQGVYPAGNANGALWASITNCTGISSCTISKTYLSTMPSDPQPQSLTYKYISLPSACTTNCINYCLYSTVENNSNAVVSLQCSNITPTPAVQTYQTQAP